MLQFEPDATDELSELSALRPARPIFGDGFFFCFLLCLPGLALGSSMADCLAFLSLSFLKVSRRFVLLFGCNPPGSGLAAFCEASEKLRERIEWGESRGLQKEKKELDH